MNIKDVSVSLNQNVKVKLNKEAKEVVDKEYSEISKILKEDIKPHIDEEGYFHAPLHVIMKTFSHMIKGCYSPFERAEIIISEINVEE